jgi:endonuclease/exonuclease/phosphatase family metal-dependent hydrolase
MIRIVTLNDTNLGTNSAARLHDLTDQLRLAEIDVLCCQGMQRSLDGSQDSARKIAELLQMTYCFSATGSTVRAQNGGKETTIRGLSILAGDYAWMLNSGSFSLPGEDPSKKQVAQFAIIRQNGNSVLVINVEFSPLASVQLQQLRAVFSHQRLQERYGAVVLCGNRNLAVSSRELHTVAALSAYKLANETTASTAGEDDAADPTPGCNQGRAGQPIDGVILTLIARDWAPAAIKIHGASAAHLLTSALASDFEIKQSPAKNPNKFFFPLSYSEQWPGLQKA